MTPVKFGFTGTRHGMSEFQKAFVRELLEKHEGEFHHGDCVGADDEAHNIARSIGRYKIHVHPPAQKELQANCVGDVVYPDLPYLVRNKRIVIFTEVLIACPKSQLEIGGTWWTINYFRQFMQEHATCGKQGYIALPNGVVGTIVTTPKGMNGVRHPLPN